MPCRNMRNKPDPHPFRGAEIFLQNPIDKSNDCVIVINHLIQRYKVRRCFFEVAVFQ